MTVQREPAMAAIILPAQHTSVAQGITFVVECAIAAGLPPQRVAEIELVIEEALVNICHYAYHDEAGNVEVHWTRDEAHQFRIELIDAGKPFNILTLPTPDLTADTGQRLVGGLGALLIRSLVDNITYRRDEGRNILQFVVQLSH
jgi:serine/threonine-protein kinase RsbW